jgi:hypothetical protein
VKAALVSGGPSRKPICVVPSAFSITGQTTGLTLGCFQGIVGKEAMLMRKLCSLSTIIMLTFAFLLLGFGNSIANAAVEVLQPRPDGAVTWQPTLITSTTFLPVIVKPPAPPSVRVVSSSIYNGEVFGEVINETSSNVTLVRVTATFYNSSGNVIRSDDSFAMIDVLAPGQKSPFRIYFSDLPEYARYELSVTYYWKTSNPAPVNLPILSSRTWEEPYWRYMVGEI